MSDIGAPAIPGYATLSNGTYSVSGAGSGIGGAADRFTFVHRSLVGDGTIVARVASLQNTSPSAMAGLMIRDSLDPGARNAFVLVSPSGAVAFQRRAGRAARTVRSAPRAGASPTWLKLERRADTITASRSSDGVTWTTIGTATIPLDGVVSVGLAVSSRMDVAPALATFTGIDVTPLAQSGAPLPVGWQAADLGGTPAGASAFKAGTFGLTAGAVQASNTSDGLRFAYTRADGDLDVIARVRAIGGDAPARAGVMIRDSLTPDGAQASMVVSARDGSIFQRRASAGGSSVSSPGGADVAPIWVKLSLRGDVVTAFQSADGRKWKLVGSDTIALPSPFYVGLGVSSDDPAGAATANIDSVRIDAATAAPEASSTATQTQTELATPFDADIADPLTAAAKPAAEAGEITISAVPTGWTAADIGNPTPAGSTNYSDPTYTMTAGGRDIWNTSDEFHFAYQALSGDVDIVARVATMGNPHQYAKAGIMIRASLAANAAHVSMLLTPANGTEFSRRLSTGGSSANTPGLSNQAPVWVKLSRRGNAITGYDSINGTTWTQRGTITLTLPATAYVGLAATSHSQSTALTATFDGVSVVPAGSNQPPTVSLTAPASGATFTAPASITVSATASDTNGTVARVDFYQGSTLIGSDTTSPYSVTWSNVPAGTYSLTAVATDNQNATTTSAAHGITVNPPANQAPTVSLTSPANGATFTAPATITINATASDADGTVSRVEFFQGSTLLGSDTTSPYSFTWSNAAAGSYSLTARATDSAGATTTSAAVTVTVSVNSGALPTGWTAADIGNPAPAGSTTYSSPTFTMRAGGADIWNASDQFHFAYQALSGDLDIVARVASLVNTNPYAKAGIMVRASLAANAAHASMLLTPANGIEFVRRPTTGASSVNVPGATSAPPVWVKLTRRGSTISAYDSLNGTTWTLRGTQTLTLSTTFYVGLAATSHNTSTATTAAFDGVSITPVGSNQPPTVSLTAPASGATFTAPASITVSASASDADGTITRVDFFQGSTLIGSDTTSPYSVTWSSVPAGTYSLTAVATDNSNATTTSAATSVTVNPPANQPPSVSLTSPASGATFTAPASVTVSANASDTDGTITRVDFYQGATLVGSDASSPYSVTWSNVPAGSYSLTAVAVDNSNATTTSAARSITVNPPANQAPTVSLTSPANGATFTAPATITLNATAADSDGTVSRVEFYQGATLLGSDTTSPYSFTWNNVAAGSYSLTARATDSAGATTTSAAVTVTVSVSSGGLPAGWTAADIGNPTPAGSSSYSSPTFTIRAGGADIWNSSDQFQFAYQALSGDLDLVARVASLVNTNPYAKAGIMIRESLAANAAHASMLLTAANGVEFSRRATTGATSMNSPGAQSPAPVWFKLTRRGSTISAYDSSNGTTWTLRGTQTLTLPATFYVGLAVTSHNTSTATTATFDGVSITPAGSNQPPSVSLTAPASGATFTAPASITVSASASDPDGTIVRVDFFQGGTLIGSDTTSPYSVTWSNAPAGTYSLTAVATDNSNVTTTSAARSVTVNPGGNQPPAAAITSPANGASFTPPATIAISATASDADGTVARVDFYQGSTLLGSDTTSPYSFTWSNVPAGSYSLTARAIDNAGATTTSAAVNVTVGTSSTRTAAFTPSADHNTLVTSYLLKIFASGANPATATPLASQNLGKPAVVNGECSADVTTLINGLAPGTYQATVSAVGNGGSSQSAPMTFTR